MNRQPRDKLPRKRMNANDKFMVFLVIAMVVTALVVYLWVQLFGLPFELRLAR